MEPERALGAENKPHLCLPISTCLESKQGRTGVRMRPAGTEFFSGKKIQCGQVVKCSCANRSG
jgi:hypothetical protein